MGNNITKANIGTCRKIYKSRRNVHVFGGKVYLGDMHAISMKQFRDLIQHKLLTEIKDNHYELSDKALDLIVK